MQRDCIKYRGIFPLDMAKHFEVLDNYYDNIKKDGKQKDAYLVRGKREDTRGMYCLT